ncbi:MULTISPECIES: LON peptidase substrate-binding domain-containing protein [Nitrincola]|uniref:Lon protease 2 n=1 Tax=Nitrincola nitratireducens TaxID=1229521 RepID=W9UXV2_9GAMM|nr:MULTISPECIES: LON peptidase substrate-binding domain-containing protein [Nitrincola]EXJ11884.1 Lon protease 2 [Nitrincola nitratireducens]
MHTLFKTPFNELPEQIPLFPLNNVVLMPGARLPLNLFEPRYLAMLEYSMKTSRLIGMVQPDEETGELARVGGVGRVQFFNETSEGRIEIVLTGLCRFDLIGSTLTDEGFLLGQVDWQRFSKDYDAVLNLNPSREQAFLEHLENYASAKNLFLDRRSLAHLNGLEMLNGLITVMPFPARDKQILLEIEQPDDRFDWLETYLAMSDSSPTKEHSRH